MVLVAGCCSGIDYYDSAENKVYEMVGNPPVGKEKNQRGKWGDDE